MATKELALLISSARNALSLKHPCGSLLHLLQVFGKTSAFQRILLTVVKLQGPMPILLDLVPFALSPDDTRDPFDWRWLLAGHPPH